MPGRKSVMYFTSGMDRGPELDNMWRNLLATANRNNVTFYSVDTNGVMTGSQNAGAMGQLNSANAASGATTQQDNRVTTDQIKASDNAETAGRSNMQLPIRDLAESTGGFLIGDSNDLRVPLRHVNEEISSYYEVFFNPAISNYDGSFRKIAVSASRKDLVIHSRNGYFALPPEARAGALLLQPRAEGTAVAILVEVPLRELQPIVGPAKPTTDVHCSLLALVKDAKRDVVQKLARDREFQVTPEQLKLGNFLDKMTVMLPAGKYSLESAVMDRASGKIGTGHSEFTVPAKAPGVAISSLTPMRSYT